MDDSPKGIFIRELVFCLIKTALFCLIAVLFNVIVLVIGISANAVAQYIPANLFTVYLGFSLFVIVSAIVLFVIGRFLLAFDEKSPKDHAVPAMIFVAGTVALIMCRDPLTMVIMLSWNTILQLLIHNMGGVETLSTPVLVGVWFICCCIMWAGINYRLLNARMKKIFIISALSLLGVVLLSLNTAGFILNNN